MTPGKLAWQMNPSVRRTLQVVRRLKQIAYTYHASSDQQARNTAERAWEAAVIELGLANNRGWAQTASSLKSTKAAALAR